MKRRPTVWLLAMRGVLRVLVCRLCAALVAAEGQRQHQRWHLTSPAAPATPEDRERSQ